MFYRTKEKKTTIDSSKRTMILFIDVTKKSTTFHLLTNFNPILPRCQQFWFAMLLGVRESMQNGRAKIRESNMIALN